MYKSSVLVSYVESNLKDKQKIHSLVSQMQNANLALKLNQKEVEMHSRNTRKGTSNDTDSKDAKKVTIVDSEDSALESENGVFSMLPNFVGAIFVTKKFKDKHYVNSSAPAAAPTL